MNTRWTDFYQDTYEKFIDLNSGCFANSRKSFLFHCRKTNLYCIFLNADHLFLNYFIVQTLPELWQTWFCDHCPGKPVPVPNHLWVKNFFMIPNLNLTWHSFMSSLRSCHWSPVRRYHCLPPAFPHEEVVDSHEVSPELLFLQAEQAKLFRCSTYVFLSRPFSSFTALLWHSLIALYPSYVVVLKDAHNKINVIIPTLLES